MFKFDSNKVMLCGFWNKSAADYSQSRFLNVISINIFFMEGAYVLFYVNC